MAHILTSISQLDPLHLSHAVPGEEQVFDITLDRATELLPVRQDEVRSITWDDDSVDRDATVGGADEASTERLEDADEELGESSGFAMHIFFAYGHFFRLFYQASFAAPTISANSQRCVSVGAYTVEASSFPFVQSRSSMRRSQSWEVAKADTVHPRCYTSTVPESRVRATEGHRGAPSSPPFCWCCASVR